MVMAPPKGSSNGGVFRDLKGVSVGEEQTFVMAEDCLGGYQVHYCVLLVVIVVIGGVVVVGVVVGGVVVVGVEVGVVVC